MIMASMNDLGLSVPDLGLSMAGLGLSKGPLGGSFDLVVLIWAFLRLV